jgi:hypothetical protein
VDASLEEVIQMLHRNEGPLDRAIRVAVGVVLVAVGLFALGGLAGEIGGLVVAGVGVLSLLTGATGFCLLYVPFGFSTLPRRSEAASPRATWPRERSRVDA